MFYYLSFTAAGADMKETKYNTSIGVETYCA